MLFGIQKISNFVFSTEIIIINEADNYTYWYQDYNQHIKPFVCRITINRNNIRT